MGVKFYLHYDSIEEKVFVSMPAEKVVIKLEPRKLEISLVAGTSQACKGNLGCGDGGKAKEAQLSYPKVRFSLYYFLLNLKTFRVLGCGNNAGWRGVHR